MQRKQYIYISFGVGCSILCGIFYFFFSGSTKQQDTGLLAATQSVVEKTKKEWYISFGTSEDARQFEENVKNNSVVGVTLHPKATRVFEKTSASFSRVISAQTPEQMNTLTNQYTIKTIEEVQKIDVFTDWNKELITGIRGCLNQEKNKRAIVDTHFTATSDEFIIHLFYIAEPGEGSHGTAVSLLAGGSDVIMIDASSNDETVDYALEGLVLATHLGATQIIMARGGTPLPKILTEFIELHDQIQFIGPMLQGETGTWGACESDEKSIK